MAVTLKDYLESPLESYCSEILDEWKNMSRIDVPVLTCMSCKCGGHNLQCQARIILCNIDQDYPVQYRPVGCCDLQC